MVISRVTDKFIFQPSRHAIPTEGKSRRLVEFGGGKVEVWTQVAMPERHGERSLQIPGEANKLAAEPDLFIFKLPGTGGRAERASAHPAEIWSEMTTEVWALNPPGYGGSSGRASLKSLHAAISAAFNELRRVAGQRPIIVTGNSLGTVGALALAAEHPISGIVLRNPPPLRELILGEYGWWNLSLGSRWAARHVPRELDSVANASRATAPALFVSSARDRLVPTRYQRQIIDSYGGEHRVMTLAEADHACPLQEHEIPQYADHLKWLRERVMKTGIVSHPPVSG